jgi:hypothetical protein
VWIEWACARVCSCDGWELLICFGEQFVPTQTKPSNSHKCSSRTRICKRGRDTQDSLHLTRTRFDGRHRPQPPCSSCRTCFRERARSARWHEKLEMVFAPCETRSSRRGQLANNRGRHGPGYIGTNRFSHAANQVPRVVATFHCWPPATRRIGLAGKFGFFLAADETKPAAQPKTGSPARLMKPNT